MSDCIPIKDSVTNFQGRKVLIIMHGQFPGYVAPIPKEIAKNLHKQGVDVEVAAISDSLSPNGEGLKFKVMLINARTLIGVYSKLIPLIRNYDIVHYFPGKGLEFLPLFSSKVRFVYNFISVSVSGHPVVDWVINKLKKVQPFFADMALYTDSELRKNIMPLFKKKSFVLPVGFASELFYPCAEYKKQEKRLLMYHGTCHPYRRLEQMIKVLALLDDRYELLIIGKDSGTYIEELIELARDLNCSDRVSFVEMPQNEIRKVIERAYLCFSYVPVKESYQDQFVLKTIEYLACGRPVISTNTRYTQKFQKAVGERNLLVCNDDVNELAKAISSSENFVNNFYNANELIKLFNFLNKYANDTIVREKLLCYYEELF